jgi:hypothetical protein
VNNTLLNTTLLVLVGALALTQASRAGRLNLRQVAAVVLLSVAAAGSVAISHSVLPGRYFGTLTDWSWVPAGALGAGVLLAATSLVVDRFRARLTMALVVGVLLLVAPMSVVTPYGPRTFLPSYVLMVAIALVLVTELRVTMGARSLDRVVTCIGLAGVLVVLSGYWAVYRLVDDAQQQRLDLLHRAERQGRTTVTLPRLPFADYVHHPEPMSDTGLAYFRTRYGVPDKLSVQFAHHRRR